MLNRDIYLRDPSTIKLANDGVANVNDEKTDQALQVLRYELETFVCDGQYEKGLNHILETYLQNINQPQQPSVWISGFYGSGKSHLAKMLRALWLDTEFPDGATARGIANLPQATRDYLKELSIQAKRHGGLHAASGTLGSGSSNVRLALLGIVFKSLSLPEQYQKAKFVMWLKKEGIYDQVKANVESQGEEFDFEIDNFYVSDVLHEALMRAKPNVFISPEVCMETLNNLYPYTGDISIDELVNSLREALSINGKIPLTVIILDEMQQYIGSSSDRSLDVQETIEMCSKNIGGKLLIVATGQSAITGTPMLKKLEGRFTIPVQLSDNDVDTVIRKVFLAKTPASLPALDKLYKDNIGELSRHLSSTAIAPCKDDDQYFHQDYPILPVRRRFWEEALRVLDQTGTDSQVRNQLSNIHKAIKTNLDQKLGNVVPADFLYFESAVKLQQARLLPSKIYNQTMTWINSAVEDERLMARACGLIFLINKINAHNPELGIKAVTETIADLMLEDISTDSSLLRGKLPKLLDGCSLLMKVQDEYRIQTEESVAWRNEFQAQKSSLFSSPQVIDTDREERLKQQYSANTKGLSVLHGSAKVPRDAQVYHGSGSPEDHKNKLYIWLRNGWTTDENSVKVDARQLGNESPLITVYLPKKNADAIHSYLIELKAAENTLRFKGTPTTTEGMEARSAIETFKNGAELRLDELFKDLFQAAVVIQAGGTQISEHDLKASLETAIRNSLLRLYPKFSEADDNRWGKVFEKAMKGAPDALLSIDYSGEAASHPVCKAIISYIGNGKKGDEIRKHFEQAPYGWPRDAIDGALIVLLVAGNLKALDERNQPIERAKLERRAIGKAVFKSEAVFLSAEQKLKLRKLYQKFGISCPSGKESEHSEDFIAQLKNLLEKAGGEEPLPAKPQLDLLDEIRLCSGNERLMAIYNAFDILSDLIEKAQSTADQIDKRLPNWQLLMGLLAQAEGLSDVDIIRSQIEHIKTQRLLLAEPDQVAPALANLSQKFRDVLNELKREYDQVHDKGTQCLSADPNWRALEPEQQAEIMKLNQIDVSSVPKVELTDTQAILKTLNETPINSFRDRIAALPSRFNKALEDAAKQLEPKTRALKLPSRTLKTAQDVDTWLEDAKATLSDAIKDGPIIVQ
ncbi:MAG: BREX system P-loop protein BrxC [Candidatus Cloacimonadota bacterium]|jgi:hypothetical protein|nr:BREX system P-loop protein BrxC [Candidatus Cloacimonadota bacterium]